MKLTANRKIAASSDHDLRMRQLTAGCEELQAQVAGILNINNYGQYLDGVYLRVIAGVPAVRVQLKFGPYDAVLYVQQDKLGQGKIQAHPPKFLSTERMTDLDYYVDWMNAFRSIAAVIHREVRWDIAFGTAVQSATVAANTDRVFYRVYEHTKDATHDELNEVHAVVDEAQAIAWAKRHSNSQTFLSVVKMIGAGHGNWDSEVIWKSWEGPDAQPLQLLNSNGLTGDVTVADLADLFRSAWESANREWGNTAEDLVEWQDAFYCVDSYRSGVADYAIANIPQLQSANMSQVHVVADEDENSGEITLTIHIDGEPVDKIRTWYVHDRWDAFLDEL